MAQGYRIYHVRVDSDSVRIVKSTPDESVMLAVEDDELKLYISHNWVYFNRHKLPPKTYREITKGEFYDIVDTIGLTVYERMAEVELGINEWEGIRYDLKENERKALVRAITRLWMRSEAKVYEEN